MFASHSFDREWIFKNSKRSLHPVSIIMVPEECSKDKTKVNCALFCLHPLNILTWSDTIPAYLKCKGRILKLIIDRNSYTVISLTLLTTKRFVSFCSSYNFFSGIITLKYGIPLKKKKKTQSRKACWRYTSEIKYCVTFCHTSFLCETTKPHKERITSGTLP